MSEQKVINYEKAKKALEEAVKWNNLPNGPKYCNSKFNISLMHCEAPVLKRMGQQYCGSNSYWSTSKELNKAILQYIVVNWSKHWPEILKILEEKKVNALKELQSYVDDLQKKIGNIK